MKKVLRFVLMISIISLTLSISACSNSYNEMIDGFKKHHTHIAIVKHDDKVLGLITMEDVLEELVGKIAEPISGGKK